MNLFRFQPHFPNYRRPTTIKVATNLTRRVHFYWSVGDVGARVCLPALGAEGSILAGGSPYSARPARNKYIHWNSHSLITFAEALLFISCNICLSIGWKWNAKTFTHDKKLETHSSLLVFGLARNTSIYCYRFKIKRDCGTAASKMRPSIKGAHVWDFRSLGVSWFLHHKAFGWVTLGLKYKLIILTDYVNDIFFCTAFELKKTT